MLTSSNTTKSHIRRTSSMRGLSGGHDQPPLPSSQNPPTTTMFLTDHLHQSQISQPPPSSDYYYTSSSYLSTMISPRYQVNPRGRNSSVGGGSEQSNFLRTCGLCLRRLAASRDLYMYKGDAAFCSLECREEQMKRDGTSTTADGN